VRAVACLLALLTALLLLVVGIPSASGTSSFSLRARVIPYLVFLQQGLKLDEGCSSACNGQFGWSVALSANGETALVGAPFDDSAGAVWVFTRSAGQWSLQATLVGDCTGSSCSGPNGTGETAGGEFGFSVALSGDGNTALIGAPYNDGNTGAAWVFTRSGGQWSQQDELVADCAGSSCTGPNGTGEVGLGEFGFSVALGGDPVGVREAGNTALVGAPGDGPTTEVDAGGLPAYGSAWVFVRSSGGWSQQAQLTGSGEGGGGVFFGQSVALSARGGTALIGGPADYGNAYIPPFSGIGSAWVFTRAPGSTAWSQQMQLFSSGPGGDSAFGTSVALSLEGDTALVGGPENNSNAGAAWVFTRSGGSWNMGTRLTGSGEVTTQGDGEFGYGVALTQDGNTALIGGPSDDVGEGAAWAFTLSNGTWSQLGTKLVGDCTSSCGGSNGTGESPPGNFGRGVALSATSGNGLTALVGGPFDSGQEGAAWPFVLVTALKPGCVPGVAGAAVCPPIVVIPRAESTSPQLKRFEAGYCGRLRAVAGTLRRPLPLLSTVGRSGIAADEGTLRAASRSAPASIRAALGRLASAFASFGAALEKAGVGNKPTAAQQAGAAPAALAAFGAASVQAASVQLSYWDAPNCPGG